MKKYLVLLFLVIAAVIYWQLQTPAVPQPRSGDPIPPLVFDTAVLVGSSGGQRQWEIQSQRMVSEDNKIFIESMDSLLLLRPDADPYVVTSSSGVWDPGSGRLILPGPTRIENGTGMQTDSGRMLWDRTQNLTLLEGGVVLRQENTVVSSQSAQFDPSSGILTLLGGAEITWKKGDEGNEE